MLPLRRQFGVERFRTALFLCRRSLWHPSPPISCCCGCGAAFALCPFVCNAAGEDQQRTVLHGPAPHPPGAHLERFFLQPVIFIHIWNNFIGWYVICQSWEKKGRACWTLGKTYCVDSESRVGEKCLIFSLCFRMAKTTLYFFSVFLWVFFSVSTICWILAHYVEF